MSERDAIVAVTEADEAAAHAIWHLCDDGPYCDLPKWLVQAFARHRTTHADEVERLREATDILQRLHDHDSWGGKGFHASKAFDAKEDGKAFLARQALEASHGVR